MRLNYISLADDTGYGVAGRRYVDLLRRAGVDVCSSPMVPGGGLGLAYEFSAGPLYADAPTILHTIPEYYPHLLRRLEAERNRAPRIGMTVWETTRLPRHWPALLASVDALIVPTEWNRQVFGQAGLGIPIHVLPHASEFEGQAPTHQDVVSLRSKLPTLESRFVFLSIATWMKRKGIDKLIAAFLEAFPGRSDVVLILKTTERDCDDHRGRWRKRLTPKLGRPDWRRTARESRAPQIVLLTEALVPGEMQALHSLGDCFVSLARGEGWGLGSYEAAFFGKPLIMTGFGGYLDFAPKELATHVDYCLVPVAVPANGSYTPDQMWAEPDLQDAIRAMRAVVSDAAGARQQGMRLKEFVNARFSAEAVTTRLLEILAETGQAAPISPGQMAAVEA